MSRQTLADTHVLLGSVETSDLDAAFHGMQGENWSPQGEARGLIRGKGLQHTSMSVGDVLVRDGVAHMVDSIGFTALPEAPENGASGKPRGARLG